MWELDVERDIADDELVPAIARALCIDRERLTITSAPNAGDFARRVTIDGGDGDRNAFYRALAKLLDTRLLVDDGEVDPTTALLVSPREDVVRVRVEAGVIRGLVEHVETDDVPDRLVLEQAIYRRTRGQQLARMLAALAPLDAGAPPDVQDARHQLTELLLDLVHRRSTPDDDRALRRTCAALQRARLPGAAADIVRCADVVLAAPWDPDADA